jgi:type VI secretion system protein ImpE
MTVQELLAAGRLGDAVAAQTALVRAKPTDADARFELTVLLCFAGELDRAAAQLDTLGVQNPELALGTSHYRALLEAESERRAVHERGGSPLLPPDCPSHVEARLDALRRLREGDAERAEQALQRAREATPAREGKLDGESFDSLEDRDDVLGPVLEIFAGGHYLWLPLERLVRLEVTPPARRIDLLWPAARLEDTSGAEANVHLPALYSGSHSAADGRLQLGLMTDWHDSLGIAFRGIGQKVLLARRGPREREIGLLELRTLELAVQASDA